MVEIEALEEMDGMTEVWMALGCVSRGLAEGRWGGMIVITVCERRIGTEGVVFGFLQLLA